MMAAEEPNDLLTYYSNKRKALRKQYKEADPNLKDTPLDELLRDVNPLAEARLGKIALPHFEAEEEIDTRFDTPDAFADDPEETAQIMRRLEDIRNRS